MHGVMHIGLVPDQTGGYRAQMAVLVKPNGLFGDRLHGRDHASLVLAGRPGAGIWGGRGRL
jgi:Protein of unknown function (DUF2867)